MVKNWIKSTINNVESSKYGHKYYQNRLQSYKYGKMDKRSLKTWTKSATNSLETKKSGKPRLELTEVRPKATETNKKRQKTTTRKANRPNSTKSSKTWQNHPEKPNQNMIENQQKVNKIRQHIKKTRLQLDIKE